MRHPLRPDYHVEGRRVEPGRLYRLRDGGWAAPSPPRCPNGHLLGARRVLAGTVACPKVGGFIGGTRVGTGRLVYCVLAVLISWRSRGIECRRRMSSDRVLGFRFWRCRVSGGSDSPTVCRSSGPMSPLKPCNCSRC